MAIPLFTVTCLDLFKKPKQPNQSLQGAETAIIAIVPFWNVEHVLFSLLI